MKHDRIDESALNVILDLAGLIPGVGEAAATGTEQAAQESMDYMHTRPLISEMIRLDRMPLIS